MAMPAAKLEQTAAESGVKVEAVRSTADREHFIRFPYSLYAEDPHWVAPLLMERRDFLDAKKNPFFDHSQVELFLARRDSRVVGRIAAVRDDNFIKFHGEQTGSFGMFECIDDQQVADALLDTARQWLRSRGLGLMLGPLSLSTNQEAGLLVEGFDSDPVVMMPYNPPYYARLLEKAGLAKAKDLYAWWVSSETPPPEKVARVAEKVKRKEGLTVRTVNMKDFKAEVQRIKNIYNKAWEKNWGFVPMTEAEFDHMAKEMKQIVVPDLLLIGEVKGEPVAFSMTLPDANVALKQARGRLTWYGLPIGLAKLLWHSRKIDQLRLITLGIVEGYRRRGIDAVMTLESLAQARKLGYRGGEISWTLEDNHLINRAVETYGGKKYKTYRVYQATLA